MVGNPPVVEAICSALCRFTGEIIYDPVMLSSTGQSLLEGYGPDSPGQIVAQCTVLTPNIPELVRLSGEEIGDSQDALRLAGLLFTKYERLRAILVKGGHAIRDGEIVDTLVWRTDKDPPRSITAAHASIQTPNTHGTGCTLAAAFASFHCLYGDDLRAFRYGVEYVLAVLGKSAAARIVKNPEGSGGLLHFSFKPANSTS